MTAITWDNAYTGKLEPGEKPALLMVDIVDAYLKPDSPLFMEASAAALDASERLLKAARAASVPVIYTNVRYRKDGSDGGHFFRKVPALSVWVEGSSLGDFPETISPKKGERIVTKQYPSAFFGTDLDTHLKSLAVDTLIIAGFSTSGCVRASTLDALQHGYIPIVATNACADRDENVHLANLYDLGKKYAELQTVSEILGWLE